MSTFFQIITWPIRWVVELILVALHGALDFIGLNPDAGYTWLLSILLLLIIVRLAVVPLMVASVRSGHKMAKIAPELDAIRKKYEGKSEPEANVAMSVETLALYRESNVNPLGSILPLLVQIPLFIGLYGVLSTAQQNGAGVGLLTSDLAKSFGGSTLGDAPLHYGLLTSHGNTTVILLGVLLVFIIAVLSFIGQYITISYNLSSQADNPMLRRFQRIPMIAIPLLLAVTGLAIPLGLLFYLAFSGIWTFVQQLLLIRYLPTPGSKAAEARNQRIARKHGIPDVIEDEGADLEDDSLAGEITEPVATESDESDPKSATDKE